MSNPSEDPRPAGAAGDLLLPPAGAPGFDTLLVRAGAGPDPLNGALLTPVHQNTTYLQDGIGRDRGYTYSRTGNPTVAALEARLGALEGAPPAIAFATGMAATTSLFLALLRSGSRVIVGDVVYGGTVRVLQQVLDRFGVRADFVDTSKPELLEAALREPADLLFLESPANPTLKLTDLRAAVRLAHAAGVKVAVDNTFLTAALQKPLDLGADVALYSTTKFLEGHNATVGGAIVSRDAELLERIRFVRNTAGTIQAPWEAWLTLRGLKTLTLRLARHSGNALAVARYLEAHEAVATVHYPWLPSSPQHALARAQQSGGGGMLAFELRGGAPAGRALMESLKLWTLAENLGAAESLVTHPATMTHGSVPPEQRRAAGISDGLVRLSAGLEDAADLVADLEQALARTAAEVPA